MGGPGAHLWRRKRDVVEAALHVGEHELERSLGLSALDTLLLLPRAAAAQRRAAERNASARRTSSASLARSASACSDISSL
jgi:hypothetical protein